MGLRSFPTIRGEGETQPGPGEAGSERLISIFVQFCVPNLEHPARRRIIICTNFSPDRCLDVICTNVAEIAKLRKRARLLKRARIANLENALVFVFSIVFEVVAVVNQISSFNEEIYDCG